MVCAKEAKIVKKFWNYRLAKGFGETFYHRMLFLNQRNSHTLRQASSIPGDTARSRFNPRLICFKAGRWRSRSQSIEHLCFVVSAFAAKREQKGRLFIPITLAAVVTALTGRAGLHNITAGRSCCDLLKYPPLGFLLAFASREFRPLSAQELAIVHFTRLQMCWEGESCMDDD